MKHTPGPWNTIPMIYESKIVAQRNGCACLIAQKLYDEDNEPTLEELEANAQLIASAPDLLEACKDAYKLIALTRPETCGYVLVKLSDAIAKAEGRNEE